MPTFTLSKARNRTLLVLPEHKAYHQPSFYHSLNLKKDTWAGSREEKFLPGHRGKRTFKLRQRSGWIFKNKALSWVVGQAVWGRYFQLLGTVCASIREGGDMSHHTREM